MEQSVPPERLHRELAVLHRDRRTTSDSFAESIIFFIALFCRLGVEVMFS